jgi:Fe-S cluster assembly iron-binding protein IscA
MNPCFLFLESGTSGSAGISVTTGGLEVLERSMAEEEEEEERDMGFKKYKFQIYIFIRINFL